MLLMRRRERREEGARVLSSRAPSSKRAQSHFSLAVFRGKNSSTADDTRDLLYLVTDNKLTAAGSREKRNSVDSLNSTTLVAR
jgi:hypothetical protein